MANLQITHSEASQLHDMPDVSVIPDVSAVLQSMLVVLFVAYVSCLIGIMANGHAR